MALLSRKPKPAALPDIGAYSEQEWRAAKTLHAWKVMTENLRSRYASAREQRVAVLEDPEERARVERYYRRLEEPLLSDEPPEGWAEDYPEALRESVIERPLGVRMVTPADLKERERREMERRTGGRWRYLSPGDGQPRPKGYGADEAVWVQEPDDDE